MCCFTGPIDRVESTRIFARLEPGGTQLLAYEMTLTVATEVAMVLPIPTPAGSPEDALEFISLQACPDFFQPLSETFGSGPVGSAPGNVVVLSAPLQVHRVGAFDASFVPSIADFDRLDPRFRLDGAVWDALPRYADWGFAVFKLQPAHGTPIHPMAFRFPTRLPEQLFFPTVHVHDGSVHLTAEYDHVLYGQLHAAAGDAPPGPPVPAPLGFSSGPCTARLPERFGWDPLQVHVAAAEAASEAAQARGEVPAMPAMLGAQEWQGHRTLSANTASGALTHRDDPGLVQGASPLHRIELRGRFINEDFVLAAA
ncbi:MAG: hypothetical protein ACYTGX_07775 [Planctomycetota bacterium]|jgi:hypothetical protein